MASRKTTDKAITDERFIAGFTNLFKAFVAQNGFLSPDQFKKVVLPDAEKWKAMLKDAAALKAVDAAIEDTIKDGGDTHALGERLMGWVASMKASKVEAPHDGRTILAMVASRYFAGFSPTMSSMRKYMRKLDTEGSPEEGLREKMWDTVEVLGSIKDDTQCVWPNKSTHGVEPIGCSRAANDIKALQLAIRMVYDTAPGTDDDINAHAYLCEAMTMFHSDGYDYLVIIMKDVVRLLRDLLDLSMETYNARAKGRKSPNKEADHVKDEVNAPEPEVKPKRKGRTVKIEPTAETTPPEAAHVKTETAAEPNRPEAAHVKTEPSPEHMEVEATSVSQAPLEMVNMQQASISQDVPVLTGIRAKIAAAIARSNSRLDA